LTTTRKSDWEKNLLILKSRIPARKGQQYLLSLSFAPRAPHNRSTVEAISFILQTKKNLYFKKSRAM
jgi:hypothetical protein